MPCRDGPAALKEVPMVLTSPGVILNGGLVLSDRLGIALSRERAQAGFDVWSERS